MCLTSLTVKVLLKQFSISNWYLKLLKVMTANLQPKPLFGAPAPYSQLAVKQPTEWLIVISNSRFQKPNSSILQSVFLFMFPILVNGNWLIYFVVKPYKIYKVEIEVVFMKYWFCEVTQTCPTLCDPMDCNLPGSSIHGIFQARILERGAISFSKGSSRPRDRSRVSRLVGRRFTVWATCLFSCK